MAQVASPQGKEEKNNVPWRIAFTRKDLLTACWNNGKMADLLYHFLHVGSCTIENNHLASDTQVVVIQDTHTKILAKVKISEPTLIRFLKVFTRVGYVRKVAHKELLEVDFAKIESAFTKPPEKPVPSDDLSLNLNIKNEQAEEVKKLSQEVEKLTSQVQDLSLTLVSLKVALAQFEHEFKFNFRLPLVSATLNQSSESALEADAEDRISIPSLDSKSIENLEYREREKDDCASAPSPCLHPFLSLDLDPLCEDLAYSQNHTPPTSSQASLEVSSAVVGAGYMTSEEPVKPPKKPVKGTKRTKKEKVVQPALVETSKGIALSEDEQLRFDWYCQEPFIKVPPVPNETKKKHLATLIPHVHSPEEMHSLAEFTRKKLQARGIKVWVIELGNMANASNLNEWLAQRQPANVINFQQARPGSWREYYENDPNNGGYNDEASLAAFLAAGEEVMKERTNAAV